MELRPPGSRAGALRFSAFFHPLIKLRAILCRPFGICCRPAFGRRSRSFRPSIHDPILAGRCAVPPPHGKPPHSSRTILRPMRWRHGRRRRCSTRALARRHSSVRIVVVILPSTIATGGCWRTPSARMISSCGTSANQAEIRYGRSDAARATAGSTAKEPEAAGFDRERTIGAAYSAGRVQRMGQTRSIL